MKTALSDKFLLLVFGVLLFFFSFPTTFGHVAFFAWVALVPLLVLNRRFVTLRACFFWNWIFFQFSFLSLFYINPFQNPERLFSLGPMVGLLSFYLVFPLLYAGMFTFGISFYRAFNTVIGVLGAAAVWVVFEYWLTCIPGMFPLSFAISQFSSPEFIQICHFTGIFGLSFVLVMINYLVFQGLQNKYLLGIACVFVGLLWAFGHQRMSPEIPASSGPVFLLIQPNVVYRDAWLSQLGNVQFSRILEMLTNTSIKAIADTKRNILVWPELSLTDFSLTDPVVVGKLKSILHDQTGIVLGMPHHRQNAVFSFDENLQEQSVYVKTLPVPGFESYHRGHEPILPVTVGAHKVGVSICYELLFGKVSAELVNNGAEILGAISFNTWLGNTNWPNLHAAYLPFRAVENSRPAFYLNNNGPSMSVTSQGVIISVLTLGTRGYLRFSPKPNTQTSFYCLYGDWFSFGCLFFVFSGVCFLLCKRRFLRRGS
jgi:apolipoprotein N-acyltransferase